MQIDWEQNFTMKENIRPKAKQFDLTSGLAGEKWHGENLTWGTRCSLIITAPSKGRRKATRDSFFSLPTFLNTWTALLAHPLAFNLGLTYDVTMLNVSKYIFNILLLARVEEFLWYNDKSSSGKKMTSASARNANH